MAKFKRKVHDDETKRKINKISNIVFFSLVLAIVVVFVTHKAGVF